MYRVAGIISFNEQVDQYQNKLEQMCSLSNYQNTTDFRFEKFAHCLFGKCNLTIKDMQEENQPIKYLYNNKEYIK